MNIFAIGAHPENFELGCRAGFQSRPPNEEFKLHLESPGKPVAVTILNGARLIMALP